MGNQILGSDKNIRLNDSPMTGFFQSFEWSPAFNAEDVFELGRDTKVATALELETQGSFDILSTGGTAGILARMIAKRNSGTNAFEGYKFQSALYVGTADAGSSSTTMIDAAGTWASAVLTGYVLQVTSGTGNGQFRTITSNTGTTITVSPAFGVALDATSVYAVHEGKNQYTLTQTDLRECVFDLVEIEKSDQSSYDRAVGLPRCFLTSLSGRADANGNATETVNFSGAFVIGAPSPYHVLRSIPALRTGASQCTLADTTVASSGYALMYLYVDERRFRNATSGDAITASLGAAGVITIAGGYTIPVTARIHAWVWDNTSPTTVYPAVLDADRPTSSFHVKGWQADIYIAPADFTNPTQNEKWLKVQSVDWNVDMRTEALRQISYNADGTAIYCRLPTYPLDITANVSVYEGDWLDWKAVLDPTVKTFGGTGTSPYTETYDFAPASLKATFAVVVQYRTKAGTLVQTWEFTDMRLDGYGARVQVQGRSEITWTLRGTGFNLKGKNV